MRVVILMGASGSGKTAIAEAIAVEHPGLADVLHFDSIGVPSAEEMAAAWGSAEAWQRAETIEWMERIASSGARAVLFEGQMRLAFLTEALAAAGLAQAHPVLVDCDDETRTRAASPRAGGSPSWRTQG